MNERNPGLTPEQAADVIRYFHNGENREARQRGWKDKVSLGEAAMHASFKSYSLLPNGEPMLTIKEVADGLDFIDHQAQAQVELSDKSDDYDKALDELVDKKNISYAQARAELDADGRR